MEYQPMYQPMHQQMLDEMERITGYVNECIFENEDTGYKVLEVESDDGLQLMTVVGIMPDGRNTIPTASSLR